MASNLTRQVSIGFSSQPTQGGETTFYKSWSHRFRSEARRVDEALFILLLESVEPLPTGSRLVVQVDDAVRKALGRESIERHTIAERMDRAIQSANDLLLQEQTKTPRTSTHRISVMLAALMPTANAGCEVVIAHIGACRAFLRRKKHIEPLTMPHTWGQENVMSGVINVKDEEDEGRYPYWRRPTRYLGAAQTVAVDFTMDAKRSGSLAGDAVRSLKLQRGDNLLLCSSRLTAAGLSREADHIDAQSASALARQLIDRAAIPPGDGAAAVVVTCSNSLQPLPVAVGAMALGVLVFLAWRILPPSPPPTETPTVIASSMNSLATSLDSPSLLTDTPAPTEDTSLTPTSTATSTPMPTSTATPTSTGLPPTLRSPTATPAPTATSTPTASPTSTSTATATSTTTSTQVAIFTPTTQVTSSASEDDSEIICREDDFRLIVPDGAINIDRERPEFKWSWMGELQNDWVFLVGTVNTAGVFRGLYDALNPSVAIIQIGRGQFSAQVSISGDRIGDVGWAVQIGRPDETKLFTELCTSKVMYVQFTTESPPTFDRPGPNFDEPGSTGP